MSAEPGYVWFLARVWPGADGVPTARIHEWDRKAGTIGKHVETAHFGAEESFPAVMERLYYEVVTGEVADPVRPDGVLIALRRETVPVPVYAAAPAYA